MKVLFMQHDHDHIKRNDLIKALITIFEYVPALLLRSWMSVISNEWNTRKSYENVSTSSDILKLTLIFSEKVRFFFFK